jgi:hypothetical protein
MYILVASSGVDAMGVCIPVNQAGTVIDRAIVDSEDGVQRRWLLPCSAALGLAGCCYAVNPITEPTSANLTASTPAVSQISMVTTTFNADYFRTDLQCLFVRDADAGFDAPVVEFDCPDAGPGEYALSNLKAQACAPGPGGTACTPLDGTLTVRTFTPACPGKGACGRLDADLTITGSSGAPNISGTATLRGAERNEQITCSLGGG